MVHFAVAEDATSEVPLEEVGVRDLRDHLSRWLDEVKAGAELTITERGKPVARIVPIEWRDELERLIEEGLVTPAENPDTDPSDWNPVKLKSGVSLSDLIIEDRRR